MPLFCGLPRTLSPSTNTRLPSRYPFQPQQHNTQKYVLATRDKQKGIKKDGKKKKRWMTSWNPPMIANVNGRSVGLTGSENLCVCVFSECRKRLNFPFIRLLSTLLSILHHIHHHVPSVCPVDSQGCSACCCPGTDRRPHPCRLPLSSLTHYTTELAIFTLIRKIPFGKLCLRQLRARGGE